MNKILLILILITLLFRFYKITEIPKGIYVDEASIGYNAYTLLKSGRDEYGKILPIYLRALETYPPALYAYLATVSIKIFGLTEFSLRISPAILGLLSVLVFGIWSAQITKNKTLGLLAGLMLAINPGHWLLSRGFHEPSLGFLLFLLGIAFLNRNLLGGLLLLSLSSYAYQPQRLIIYFVVLWVIYSKKKKSISPIVVFLVTQIPQFILPESLARLNSLQIKFSLYEFLSQYTAYFSPKNLFWLPDPDPQRSLPELSIFYAWQIIPMLIGLWKLKKYPFMWFILLISPIATALTHDPFSTIRANLILIPMNFTVALGLKQTNQFIIVLLLFISSFQLYRSFFILLPNERYQSWNYGYKRLFEVLEKYNLPIVVDTNIPAYILYLFYQIKLPQIEFRNIVLEKDIYKNQLLVGGSLMVSNSQATEHDLKLEERVEDFFIYRTDPIAKCLKSVDIACKNILSN